MNLKYYKIHLANKLTEKNNKKETFFQNSSFLPGGKAFFFLVSFGALNKCGFVTIHKSRLIF